MTDNALWKQINELFLPITQGSITTLSKTGEMLLTTGMPPEQCSVTSTLDADCLKEALNTKIKGNKIAIVVLSHPTEFSQLQTKIMTNLAFILPAICMKEDDRLLTQFRHASAFLPTILTSSDVPWLCKTATNYIMHGFEITNCTIIANNTYRYNNNSQLEPHITMLEKKIAAHVEQTKTPLLIKDAAKDILTKDIQNFQQNAQSFVAYPLVHDRTYQGTLIIAFTKTPDFEALSALSSQLALGLSIVQRYTTATDMAHTDPLTKLGNRAALINALTTYLPEAKNSRKPTSLAVIDIDDFKIYNDTNGHLQGDKLIYNLACIMQESMQNKNVYRYGGEEFIVFFPDTGQENARSTATKILEACPKIGVTVSIGIATCQNSSLGAFELINHADKALYKAKNSGKNRIVHTLIIDKNLGVIDIEEANSIGKFTAT